MTIRVNSIGTVMNSFQYNVDVKVRLNAKTQQVPISG